jgi:hypothetical protein
MLHEEKWVLVQFIHNLYAPLRTTSIYSATTNLSNLQMTTATAKPFSSLLCLHQPFPSNGVKILQLPELRFYPHSLLCKTEFSTDNKLICPSCLPYNHFTWTKKKTQFPTITLLLYSYYLPRGHVYKSLA